MLTRTTLKQWQILQAVVDHGGYAQAAEHLHRSQSSVSYAVAKLQEQLGVELLHIDGRKARLTEPGKVLLRRSRQLLQEANQLEQFAGSLSAGWEPEIRLVVDVAFPTSLLINALAAFEPASRGTRVQLREVVLSGVEEALLAGETDLVIGTRVPSGFLGDPLSDIEFVAVAHPEHPLHQLQRELTVADIETARQVVISDSGLGQRQDMGWLGGKQRWSVSRLETAIATIRHGLGFGWLPRHLIQDLLESSALKPLPLREGKTYQVQLYLIFGQQDVPGPATRLLADIFREHFSI